MSSPCRHLGLQVVLAALFLAGCPEEHPPSADAGPDVTPPAIAVEIGVRDEDQWAPITQDEPTFEVVSGFQGGYHIEPALRIEDPGASEFITVVDYQVTDVDSGEVLTAEPASYRINQRSWRFVPDVGYVRAWQQVVLDVVDPDAAAGRTVEISVQVEVEGGLGIGTDQTTVRLIDKVNELR